MVFGGLGIGTSALALKITPWACILQILYMVTAAILLLCGAISLTSMRLYVVLAKFVKDKDKDPQTPK